MKTSDDGDDDYDDDHQQEVVVVVVVVVVVEELFGFFGFGFWLLVLRRDGQALSTLPLAEAGLRKECLFLCSRFPQPPTISTGCGTNHKEGAFRLACPAQVYGATHMVLSSEGLPKQMLDCRAVDPISPNPRSCVLCVVP